MFPLNKIVEIVWMSESNRFTLFPGYIRKCYKTNIYPAVNWWNVHTSENTKVYIPSNPINDANTYAPLITPNTLM